MISLRSSSSNEPQPCGASGKLALCKNELLGIGSMGTRVYKGFFEGTLPVAIKKIHDDIIQGIDNRLLVNTVQQANEAKLLRKFNHPNVVRYYLADSDEDFVYIALELCEGCLVDYIEKTAVGNKFTLLYGNKGQQIKKVIIHCMMYCLD